MLPASQAGLRTNDAARSADDTALTGDAAHGASRALVGPGQGAPFAFVTSLFFLWGIPNNLNDVLIGQFMKSFTLTRFEAGLVQSAFYLGYFLLALPAALLMRRIGYKGGILTGLLLFGVGAGLFWPAALAQRYAYFLFALFVMASGLAFLETAANPFITQLGSPAAAERRLNLAQAFNPIGAICGVLLGTFLIFSGVELSPAAVAASKAAHTYQAYLRSETLRVITPYAGLAVVAFTLAAIFAFVRFPVLANDHVDDPQLREQEHGSFAALLRQRRLLAAALTQFLYLGAQVGTWSFFIQYVQLYGHQTQRVAGFFLTGTLVAFALGRFSSAWIMQRIPPERLMAMYSVCNIALVSLAILFPGWAGVWAIFLTSFFMSIMFPTIFALGVRGLGNNTKLGSSLLVMSIIGGAVLTPIMGLLSEWTHSLAIAYLVPLVAYIAVALFSLSSRRSTASQTA